MALLRVFFVMAVSLGITTAAVAAPNVGFNRRHRINNGTQGTVVQVHHDRLHRNTGWIKLRHGTTHYYGRRRGTSAYAAASRRFGGRRGGSVMTVNVNPSTRFQRLGQRGRSAGLIGFASIHRGERVRVYLGSQRVARLVDVLPYSYYRTRHRYGYGYYHRRYYAQRHFYHRHPLVYNRVLVRTGRYPIRVNRNVFVRRPIVNRWVRHPLIAGSVAARQHRRAIAAQVVKHAVQNHRPTPPKHTVVHKPAPPKHTVAHKAPPRHTTTHRPSPSHGHSAPHPHSSGHRRK